MPTNWQTFPIEFRGGLISNQGSLQQGIQSVGSATFLQNFEVSKEGGYKKILGYQKFLNATVSGSGPMLGVKVVNNEKVIAVRSNGTASQYYINGASSWTSLATASSLGNRVKSADFNFDGNHKIFFVDGVNSPAIFNDTTDTLTFPSGYPTDVVGGTEVEVFKNIIFVAKGPNLAFSSPYDPEDFSPANGGGVINVGHTITGLIVFRDQLIIFSPNAIQRLVGSSVADFQLVPIAEAIGCIDGNTIQEVGGDVMFLAADGLRLLGATERIGDFALNVASAPIEEDTKSFISSTTNFSSLVIRGKAQYRIFAYIENQQNSVGQGLLATKFSDQGAADIQWAKSQGIRAYVADGRYVETQEKIVFANDDGYVYSMETGSSFDGDSIEAVYTSPFMPINDPQIRKTLYKAALFADIEGVFNVSLTLNYDLFQVKNFTNISPAAINLTNTTGAVFVYGSPTAVYGTATYGVPLDKIYETPVTGSGRTFSFTLRDNSTNPSYKLDSMVFEYTNNDRY